MSPVEATNVTDPHGVTVTDQDKETEQAVQGLLAGTLIFTIQ